MAKTVKEVVDAMKKAQGFVLFVTYAVRQPNGDVTLEHQYMRQQFIPEDLEKSFEHFSQMLAKDLADSGVNLVKTAEKIANTDNPVTPDN